MGKHKDKHGTVVEADGSVKVQWDDGATSYFRRNKPANVKERCRRRGRRDAVTGAAGHLATDSSCGDRAVAKAIEFFGVKPSSTGVTAS
jgi:hypothetical protein